MLHTSEAGHGALQVLHSTSICIPHRVFENLMHAWGWNDLVTTFTKGDLDTRSPSEVYGVKSLEFWGECSQEIADLLVSSYIGRRGLGPYMRSKAPLSTSL